MSYQLFEWSDDLLKKAEKVYDEGEEMVLSFFPEKVPTDEELALWKEDIEAMGGTVTEMKKRPVTDVPEEESTLGDWALDIALFLPLLTPWGRAASLAGTVGKAAIKAGSKLLTPAIAVGGTAAAAALKTGTQKGSQAILAKQVPTVGNKVKGVLAMGAAATGAVAVGTIATKPEVLEKAEGALDGLAKTMHETAGAIKWSLIGVAVLYVGFKARKLL